MVWIYYLVAGITGLAVALMEFYVRVLPTRREDRAKNTEDKKIVTEELSRAIKQAQNYEYIELHEYGVDFIPIGLEKVLKNARLSKKLLRELTQVKGLAEKYNQWFSESRQVIRADVALHMKLYPHLDEAFKSVLGSLDDYLAAAAPSRSRVDKAIYRGVLTFEMARDELLQNRWDIKAVIKDKSGKEEFSFLKEIIDGPDFHRLVEGLKGLEERQSIKALRDAHAKFLEKAELILKKVS